MLIKNTSANFSSAVAYVMKWSFIPEGNTPHCEIVFLSEKNIKSMQLELLSVTLVGESISWHQLKVFNNYLKDLYKLELHFPIKSQLKSPIPIVFKFVKRSFSSQNSSKILLCTPSPVCSTRQPIWA